MKAIVLNRYGGPAELQVTREKRPAPGASQVLIKVKAIGINPVDTKVRAGTSGMCKNISLPAIIGWDVSGIIETCGDEVSNFKPGDEVFGCIGFPGPGKAYAEFAVANTDHIAKKPENISFEEAAALPIAGLTAYQSINEHLKVQSGQAVLIQAAAGGVGHLSVQLAKLKNARVIGVASKKNKSFVKSLGADKFIDYTHESFENIVKDLDAIQDAMGGEVLYRSISCLRPFGRIVCLPSSTKDDPKALALAHNYSVDLSWPMMRPSADQLKLLAGWLSEGKLDIHLDKVFPFNKMPEAHEQIETHRTVGKVVVKVD